MTTIANQIMRMAARSTGVRVDEVHGFEGRQVFNALARLTRAGKLHQVRIEHNKVRYFAYATMRDLFVKQVQLERVEAARAARMRQPLMGRAPWGADTPAVKPKHVSVQVCPAFRPRFQEHTFGFVHGVA